MTNLNEVNEQIKRFVLVLFRLFSPFIHINCWRTVSFHRLVRD